MIFDITTDDDIVFALGGTDTEFDFTAQSSAIAGEAIAGEATAGAAYFPPTTFDIETDEDIEFECGGSEYAEFDFDSYIPIHSSDIPSYTGEYEFTPSLETQTIRIRGKEATQDITINPIPNNYGLISWDGAILTVR